MAIAMTEMWRIKKKRYECVLLHAIQITKIKQYDTKVQKYRHKIGLTDTANTNKN